MNILLKQHHQDTDIVEMWTTLSGKPMLMATTHIDCFLDDPTIHDYIVKGEQVSCILTKTSITGWSFA